MNSALRPSSLVLVAALALGSLAPPPVHAAGPTAELRVPAAPSAEVETRLAELLAALPEEQHAALLVVVADADARLRASIRAAADGQGEAVSVAEACRAAVLAADLAGVSKRRKKLPALVELTMHQLVIGIHGALRERVGRQLAVRAVQACGGDSVCLDGITPSPSMPARHVASVRAAFGTDVAALGNEERAGAAELDVLGVMYATGFQLLITAQQGKAQVTSRE